MTKKLLKQLFHGPLTGWLVTRVGSPPEIGREVAAIQALEVTHG